MKTLFLVDGAAGTGKSDLLRYIAQKKKSQATFIPKYTTRNKRHVEEKRKLPLDLRFPPESHPRFLQRTNDPTFYWYTYGSSDGEEFYGFYKENVKSALKDHNIVFVIVRDFETISRIKDDFPGVQCVSVFVYTDRDLVIDRLRRDGFSEEEIEYRLSRQPLAWADYMKHSVEYDEKIINSSDRKDFELLIEALVRKYAEVSPGYLVVSGRDKIPPAFASRRL